MNQRKDYIKDFTSNLIDLSNVSRIKQKNKPVETKLLLNFNEDIDLSKILDQRKEEQWKQNKQRKL